MVDVMLVLLIIFMVAAPLMVQGVPLDLPKTSAAKLQPLKKPTIVSLTAEGMLEIRLGDLVENVDKARLVPRLMELKSEIGDGIVYVRADRKIPYGDVMELLGRVGESGLSRISLLSQPQPSQSALPAPSQSAPPAWK